MLVEATRKTLVSSGEIEAGTVVRDGDRFLLKSTAAWVDLETGASISAVSARIEVLSGAKLVVGEGGPAPTSGCFHEDEDEDEY